MKDSNNNPISFYYEFEDNNIKTKILEKFHLSVIINKKMSKLLMKIKLCNIFMTRRINVFLLLLIS